MVSMENIYALFESLKKEIEGIDHKETDGIQKAKLSVAVSRDTIRQLADALQQFVFENRQQEIYFFKEINPQFYSLLFYYQHVYGFELVRSIGDKEATGKEIEKLRKRITEYVFRHRTFYTYYRCTSTDQDEHYFVRGNDDTLLAMEDEHYFVDTRICTVPSYMIARIRAGEMLQSYLEEQSSLSDKTTPASLPTIKPAIKAGLNWQATKVALAELCYAIYSYGAVAPATVDVKKIADNLSQAFNMPLDNIYKMYEEMRLRKKDRTPFLHALILSLNRKMDYDDENAA